MWKLGKSYKDRVGRIVTISKDVENKKYTITTQLGTTFSSFTYPSRASLDRELKSKYRPLKENK